MKQLGAAELSLFYDQLGIALKAGLPIEQGLKMMEEEIRSKALKNMLNSLSEYLESGTRLDEAMQEVASFPVYSIQMIKIGLEAGKLEEVILKLKNYYEDEERLNTNIKQTLTYPVILLGVVSVVIWAMSTQVIPIFREVWGSLDVDLSWCARGMMGVGELVRWGMLGVVSLVEILVLSIWGHKKITGKNICLGTDVAIERFWVAMELMISSGLDIEYAVGLATDSIEHPKVHQKLREVEAKIRAGEIWVDALEETGLFGVLPITLLRIGMRTGYLDENLTKIAQMYQTELQEKLEGWLEKLEGVMIVILAGMIGSTLLSVMIPLMNILSAIG